MARPRAVLIALVAVLLVVAGVVVVRVLSGGSGAAPPVAAAARPRLQILACRTDARGALWVDLVSPQGTVLRSTAVSGPAGSLTEPGSGTRIAAVPAACRTEFTGGVYAGLWSRDGSALAAFGSSVVGGRYSGPRLAGTVSSPQGAAVFAPAPGAGRFTDPVRPDVAAVAFAPGTDDLWWTERSGTRFGWTSMMLHGPHGQSMKLPVNVYVPIWTPEMAFGADGLPVYRIAEKTSASSRGPWKYGPWYNAISVPADPVAPGSQIVPAGDLGRAFSDAAAAVPGRQDPASGAVAYVTSKGSLGVAASLTATPALLRAPKGSAYTAVGWFGIAP